MVDLIHITLKAGSGGDGRISFHTNRYQLKGGPDGGNGGSGGSILLRANRNLHSLRDFAGKTNVEAQNGAMGGKAKMFGSNAPDLTLQVPEGTSIWRVDEEYIPRKPNHMYTISLEGERREWLLGVRRKKNQEGVIPKVLPITKEKGPLSKVFRLHGRDVTATLVGEVVHDGDALRVAKGGRGGRGNFEFRSSTHTTPREAETGQGGEAGTFFFELQVLADVGFVGFPNVGKSTLLSVLTSAQPEIANYPFTTLEPNLGILDFPSHKPDEKAQYVVADIPGIIEGASQGKGLGTSFLRHIERSRVLVFVLSLDDYEILEHADDASFLAQKLGEQYRQLQEELSLYEEQLQLQGADESRTPILHKKHLVVINKADLFPEALQQTLATLLGKELGYPLFISAKSNVRIDELRNQLQTLLA